VCVCVCVYMFYLCVCVCIYIYIYIIHNSGLCCRPRSTGASTTAAFLKVNHCLVANLLCIRTVLSSNCMRGSGDETSTGTAISFEMEQ